MFESLIDSFQVLKRKALGYGHVTKTEIDNFLKDLKITLLSADINYKVVKSFIGNLEEKLKGLPIERSLSPGEMILSEVYKEMVHILGDDTVKINIEAKPSIINLIGLQGTGKTTTCGKLAHRFKSLNPLLVALDNKRPAAKEQLKAISERVGVSFYTSNQNPTKIAQEAKKTAKKQANNLIILDTAGRLHIDEELVNELKSIRDELNPEYNLIVVDGMTGQDAVIQARTFHEKVGLDGAIITKLDGDARGGAAISLRSVADVPIFFIGIGERIDDLEVFHPDRIAQRILGMGDVKTLIEKTAPVKEDTEKIRKKVEKGEFDLEDLLKQLKTIKKMGPLSNLIAMVPGMSDMDADESELIRIEAIINSMTPKERRYPKTIDGSRKRRIAQGSGTKVEQVNRLLRQYFQLKKFMKKHGKDLTRRGIVLR